MSDPQAGPYVSQPEPQWQSNGPYAAPQVQQQFPPHGTPTIDQPHYGIGPVAALKRGFVKYARFDGRASRSEYWWFALLSGVVLAVIWIVAVAVALATSPDAGRTPGTASFPLLLVALLAYLAWVVPSLSILVRRLHDGGNSGWLALLILIPTVGGIILLVMAALQSQPAGARFDRSVGFQP
jgi:uncharacterized membrane protein YhaH (DUF805 family)